MNVERAIAGYDRLAPWYEWIERVRFGRTLNTARLALVGLWSSPRRILVVGDGDGRLLHAIARQHPRAEITSIDLSGVMLRLQRQRLSAEQLETPVHWIQADVRGVSFPAAHFDLIVTAFFLDCFTEVQLGRVLRQLAHWLRPDGRWCIVDFVIPERTWRRAWARGWLWLMHLFFRWQTGLEARRLVDPVPILESLGLQLVAERRFHAQMIRSAIYRRPSSRAASPVSAGS